MYFSTFFCFDAFLQLSRIQMTIFLAVRGASFVTRLFTAGMWVLASWVAVCTALIMPDTVILLGISRFAHHRTQPLRSPKWTVVLHMQGTLVTVLGDYITKLGTSSNIISVSTRTAGTRSFFTLFHEFDMINMAMTVFEQITAENDFAERLCNFSLTNAFIGPFESVQLSTVIALARNAETLDDFVCVADHSGFSQLVIVFYTIIIAANTTRYGIGAFEVSKINLGYLAETTVLGRVTLFF